MSSVISLRSISDTDIPLLESLYFSARELELSQVQWPNSEKNAFLKQQFDAQHKYYQQHYSGARFEIIELDGIGVGRLYQQWRVDEVRLMDIALLPKWRGRGVGKSLILNILDQAAARNLPVILHVEPYNFAFGWYRRLGFEVTDDNGVYLRMRWSSV